MVFKTTIAFSEGVEKLSVEKNLGLIEAIAHWCELHDVEPDRVASLITSDLREKIANEANELHLIKNNTA